MSLKYLFEGSNKPALKERRSRVLTSVSRSSSGSRGKLFSNRSLSQVSRPNLPNSRKTPHTLTSLMKKYLNPSDSHHDLQPAMSSVLALKQREVQTLKIYRDQLLVFNLQQKQHGVFKLPVQTLRKRVQTQQQLHLQQTKIQSMIQQMRQQTKIISQYLQYVLSQVGSTYQTEYSEEKNLLVENLEMEGQVLQEELQKKRETYENEKKIVEERMTYVRRNLAEKQKKLQIIRQKLFSMYIRNHRAKVKGELQIGIRDAKGAICRTICQDSKPQYIRICAQGKGIRVDCQNKPNYYESLGENWIKINTLLSLKAFMKSKIVGVEIRYRETGAKVLQIGNCSWQLQTEIISLSRKQIKKIQLEQKSNQVTKLKLYYEQKPERRKRSGLWSNSNKQIRNSKPKNQYMI